jgi:hypothetical protein
VPVYYKCASVARQCLKTSIYAFRACNGTLLDSAIEFSYHSKKKKEKRKKTVDTMPMVQGAFMLNSVKLKSQVMFVFIFKIIFVLN